MPRHVLHRSPLSLKSSNGDASSLCREKSQICDAVLPWRAWPAFFYSTWLRAVSAFVYLISLRVWRVFFWQPLVRSFFWRVLASASALAWRLFSPPASTGLRQLLF